MAIPVIAVFDSGVGGLSVADEIATQLPDAALAYICDNAFFPYGTKEEGELIERVDRVVSQAVAAIRPDLLVVACNTASTVVLPRLRSRLAIPVIGVVPAVKPAAARSSKRIIGLLGTPGTVRRAYTQDLIDRFAADCTVLRVGSTELVEMAEALLAGEAPSLDEVTRVLVPFFDGPAADHPDVIVLACTHFPLLTARLQVAAPADVAFIDSGRAVAERARLLLERDGFRMKPEARSNFLNDNQVILGDFTRNYLMMGIDTLPTATPNHQAYFTRDDSGVERRRSAFASRRFADIFFLTSKD
ncbi:MAG: glutamate racemase [Aliidongia sp.]